MMRTRLLWFGLGFTSSTLAISHFVWKNVEVDRHALTTDINHKFQALQARISNLESSLPNHAPIPLPHHDQVLMALCMIENASGGNDHNKTDTKATLEFLPALFVPLED
ncbi:hypothetical protein RJT34_15621 [Clitoria ternatea]|uniref:Uncharacterized protein n=1 Tax=Clitoria ternatea TaxID=43366 RepID=A0AAN9J7N7_CLITE